MAWKAAERLPVLGHCPPGDLDALLVQNLGQLVVAERFGFGLVFDELGDGVFHAGIAEVLTRVGFYAVSEEVFKLKSIYVFVYTFR